MEKKRLDSIQTSSVLGRMTRTGSISMERKRISSLNTNSAIRKIFQANVYQNKIRDTFLATPEFESASNSNRFFSLTF
jgi:hypothetical protein